MPERFARMVAAIKHLFEDMGIEAVEERVVHFIVQEIHSGKTVEEAMNEPYVMNNTSEAWRRGVLERPEIIKAVEEEMEKALDEPIGGSESD